MYENLIQIHHLNLFHSFVIYILGEVVRANKGESYYRIHPLAVSFYMYGFILIVLSLVTGKVLADLKDTVSIAAIGIAIPPVAEQDFLDSIQVFKTDGVPKPLLESKSDIHDHLLNKEDEAKKIYCSTGVATNPAATTDARSSSSFASVMAPPPAM